jgi:hypothetical protein
MQALWVCATRGEGHGMPCPYGRKKQLPKGQANKHRQISPGGNMPFIRGRYHMNPVVGHAMESAREAQAALQALEHAAKIGRGEVDGDDSPATAADAGKGASGPIHRVEIEAAELVPSHSGRAQKGFVARVHRRAPMAPNSSASLPGRGYPQSSGSVAPSGPETHVFTDHNDLMNFLSDEFKKDCND